MLYMFSGLIWCSSTASSVKVGLLLTARSRKQALSAAAPMMPTIALAAVMPAAVMKVMLNLWAGRLAMMTRGRIDYMREFGQMRCTYHLVEVAAK